MSFFKRILPVAVVLAIVLSVCVFSVSASGESYVTFTDSPTITHVSLTSPFVKYTVITPSSRSTTISLYSKYVLNDVTYCTLLAQIPPSESFAYGQRFYIDDSIYCTGVTSCYLQVTPATISDSGGGSSAPTNPTVEPLLKRVFSDIQATGNGTYSQLEIDNSSKSLTYLPGYILDSDGLGYYKPIRKQYSAPLFTSLVSQLYQIQRWQGQEAQLLTDLYHYLSSDLGSSLNRLSTTNVESMAKTINALIPPSAQDDVAEAFDIIRKTGIDKETVYTCYVTDRQRRLIGVVSARTLMLSDSKALTADIMEKNVISVKTLDDKEFVANQLQKYDFLALPVVDSEDRMIGIVTVDDAIDVIVDEYSEDIEIMAAITPTDKPYLKQSVFSIYKNRIPWLLLLMISATFTGMIISSFEAALAAQVALTAFIPMLMDTGGNSGSQASVTVIRGISLDEISFSDTFFVMWKELRVSALCGVSLAAATFIKIQLVDNLLMHNGVSIAVSAVVCLTLLFTVVCAKLIGCTLPLLAKKIGFDPAVMASPFITTIVDAISLLLYFFFAKAMLGL